MKISLRIFNQLPRQIFLVRHGETPTNPLNILQGSSASGLNLSETGRTQAQRLGQHLSKYYTFDEVWSSDYTRAIQTAQLITTQSNLYPKSKIDIRLRERHYGEAEGKPLDAFLGEARRLNLEHFYHEPKDSESFKDMMTRVESIFEELSKGKNRKVLLVTHGGFLLFFNKFVSTRTNLQVENFDPIRGFEMCPNTGVTKVVLNSKNGDTKTETDGTQKISQVIFETISDTTHLKQDDYK